MYFGFFPPRNRHRTHIKGKGVPEHRLARIMKIREHREAARNVLIRFLFGALLLFSGFGILLAAAFAIQSHTSRELKEDLSPLLADKTYSQAVEIREIQAVSAQISEDYAVIVMMGQALGQTVTEEQLQKQNGGRVSCAGAGDYVRLMASCFPGYAPAYRELTPDTEAFSLIHQQLSSGVPVPVRLLCQKEENSESPAGLCSVLVTGLDMEQDTVTVNTPFGYEKEYSLEEFSAAIRWETRGALPWYEQLGLLGADNDPGTVFLLSPSDEQV